MPIRRLLLFLILINSTSLYRILTFDDNHSDSPSNLLLSTSNANINPALALNNRFGYFNDDDDDDMIVANDIDDRDKDNTELLFSLISQMKQEDDQKPVWKRSSIPIRLHSSKALPQRRNNRPHWNPLVAAYKRCGELSRREEREACFKDAIQMLFVHKLK